MTRLLVLAAAAALAGCAGPRHSPADQASIAACRSRADAVYAKQNSNQLYRSDTQDSPFASSGLRGFTSAGLGGLHERDSALSDCIRQSTIEPAGSIAAAP